MHGSDGESPCALDRLALRLLCSPTFVSLRRLKSGYADTLLSSAQHTLKP